MLTFNKRFMGRAAAVLGLSALCSALITPVPALAEANKVVTGSECADYTVIGMRGSDTSDIDQKNTNNLGKDNLEPLAGNPNSVYRFASEALRKSAPSDKSVKFLEVSYSPVDEYIGFGGTLRAAPADYESAVTAGGKKFVDEVNKAVSSCSSTNIILFGYGEGAGAMRVSFEKLGQQQREAIKAVWFMSDEMHDGSGDDGFEYYDAYTGWDKRVNGFMRLSNAYYEANQAVKNSNEKPKEILLRDKLPAPIKHTIPSDLKSKILSMCDGKDGFCSPSEDVNIMIDSSPWHYVRDSYMGYGSKRVFEIASGVSLEDSKADGLARSNHEAQVIHKGNGATWVVEKGKEYIPELVTSCISDYAVIGVRGSGEDIDGGLGKQDSTASDGTKTVVETKGGLPSQRGAIRINGFSDILATAAWGIKENLPQDSTIRFIPVDYPAQSVEQIRNAPDMYLSSVDQGKVAALEATRNILKLCPTTKVILMGYSQGAMAAHLALKELEADHRQALAGAYFIADPIRDNTDNSTFLQYDENSGSGFALEGKSDLFKSNGVARRLNLYTEHLDSDLNANVIEVCHTKDTVCNLDGSKATLEVLLHGNSPYVEYGFSEIHPKVYNQQSQFWGFPTQWAASKLVRSRLSDTLPKSIKSDSVFKMDDNGYHLSFF